MRTILIESDSADQYHRANVLVGSTIVAVEFPPEDNVRVVLKLDDGTAVHVSGKGYEVDWLEMRIEVPE
jgi:hypothetical protein